MIGDAKEICNRASEGGDEGTGLGLNGCISSTCINGLQVESGERSSALPKQVGSPNDSEFATRDITIVRRHF
jgi:hypothetical protein